MSVQGTSVALAWMAETLSSSHVLQSLGYANRIFRNRIPDAAPYPAIVFSTAAGGANTNSADALVFCRPIILVKVVSDSETNEEDADAALHAIASVLDHARSIVPVETPGGTNNCRITCIPQTDIEYPEPATGDVTYYHQGRMWQVTVAPESFS